MAALVDHKKQPTGEPSWKDVFRQGVKQYSERCYRDAVQSFTKCLPEARKKGPTHAARVLVSRAAAYGALLEFESATADAKQCVALDPQGWQGYYRSARLFQQTRRYKSAITFLDHALTLVPAGSPASKRLMECKQAVLADAGGPANITSRINKDPLTVLPHELVDRVFEIGVECFGPTFAVRPSWVSRSWRDTILACPSAWKRFKFSFDVVHTHKCQEAETGCMTSSFLTRLVEWHRRARGRIEHLHLHGLPFDCQAHGFQDKMVVVIKTVKVLVLNGTYNKNLISVYENFFDTLHQKAECLERLELVNFCGFTNPSSPVVRLDAGIPHPKAPLRYLKSELTFPLQSHDRPQFDQLVPCIESLYVDELVFWSSMLADFRPAGRDKSDSKSNNFVRACPNLVDLTLNNVGSTLGDLDLDDVRFMERTTFEPLILPRLKIIRNYSWRGMINISAPHLEHLELAPMAFSNDTMALSIPHIPRFCRFPWPKIKTLVFPDEPDPDRSSDFDLSQLSALENLTIVNARSNEPLEAIVPVSHCPHLHKVVIRGGEITGGPLIRLVDNRLQARATWAKRRLVGGNDEGGGHSNGDLAPVMIDTLVIERCPLVPKEAEEWLSRNVPNFTIQHVKVGKTKSYRDKFMT